MSDLVAGTSERWGGDPRHYAADALATFLEMSDRDFHVMLSSPGVPWGMTPAEQEGLEAAMTQRKRVKFTDYTPPNIPSVVIDGKLVKYDRESLSRLAQNAMELAGEPKPACSNCGAPAGEPHEHDAGCIDADR